MKPISKLENLLAFLIFIVLFSSALSKKDKEKNLEENTKEELSDYTGGLRLIITELVKLEKVPAFADTDRNRQIEPSELVNYMERMVKKSHVKDELNKLQESLRNLVLRVAQSIGEDNSKTLTYEELKTYLTSRINQLKLQIVHLEMPSGVQDDI